MENTQDSLSISAANLLSQSLNIKIEKLMNSPMDNNLATSVPNTNKNPHIAAMSTAT